MIKVCEDFFFRGSVIIYKIEIDEIKDFYML